MKKHNIVLTDSILKIDGVEISIDCKRNKRLDYIYDMLLEVYPKYYRMDGLCKLGYIASELLVKKIKENEEDFHPLCDAAVIIFSNLGSFESDCRYEADLQKGLPRAGDFVYTLPNIIAGEIASKNGIKGLTAVYLIPQKNQMLMDLVVRTAMNAERCRSGIYGWLDFESETKYEADLYINEI